MALLEVSGERFRGGGDGAGGRARCPLPFPRLHARHVGRGGAAVRGPPRHPLRRPRPWRAPRRIGSIPWSDLGRDVLAIMDRLNLAADFRPVAGRHGGPVAGAERTAAPHPPHPVQHHRPCRPARFWDHRIKAVRKDGTGPIADSVIDSWFTPQFKAQRPARGGGPGDGHGHEAFRTWAGAPCTWVSVVVGARHLDSWSSMSRP